MSCRNKEKHEHKSYNGSMDHRGQNLKNDTYRRKSPLRVQDDWSEHISSKGHIYYYNCRTEVSQWQKPIEWTLPQMSPDVIKKLVNNVSRNGETASKRVYSNSSTTDVSPKRLKLSTNNEKKMFSGNQNTPKPVIKPIIKVVSVQNHSTHGNKSIKINDDDMDISPGSSPLSGGSNSSECDKKIQNPIEPELNKNCQAKKSDNFQLIHIENNKKLNNETIHNLTSYQMSLVAALRSILTSLKTNSVEFSRSHPLENHNFGHGLSVYQISDLLMRIDTVSHNGDTCHSYRSHRLHAQLSSQDSLLHHSASIEYKSSIKSQAANISHVKEAVKTLQQFLQEQYPNINITISPVSPTYSKSNRISYYLQVLSGLLETCLLQICPQSLNSPSSTSSPGSSNISVATSVTSNPYVETFSKLEIDSPCKKEKIDQEKPKSILQDPAMLKYVSQDVTNTYRNQLADYYEKEAQVEYYKFVRLHSVLYSDLACESKKLKALVRISEINTELLRQKKEDLTKLIHMLDSRRLPNHLKCDFVPT